MWVIKLKKRTLLKFLPVKNCPSLIGKNQSTVVLTGKMSRRHSVNRPPTPDARDDDDVVPINEPTLREIVSVKLIESGEKERLLELVRERLVECGWKDEMRALCRAVVKKNGRDNVTVDDLVRAITPKGRASIPDSVKAELLQKIRTFLLSVAH